jgi:uncharacterized protein YndB with AHSA1/START domain
MDSISIVAEFPNTSPEALFDYWTKPDLLKKWWPPIAELNPETNGRYHFSWPKQNWNLRGRFTQFRRGRSLRFTWKWDHEPTDATEVGLSFDQLPGGGTRLTLHHGTYAENADGRKIRDEHVEGWMYFLGRLRDETNPA